MEFKCKEFSLNHTLSSMKVGTDAILLSSLAERNHKKHILEIGTGCGIISLAMAQLNKTAKITLSTIHTSPTTSVRHGQALSGFLSSWRILYS